MQLRPGSRLTNSWAASRAPVTAPAKSSTGGLAPDGALAAT
jgi:hypothetical protein